MACNIRNRQNNTEESLILHISIKQAVALFLYSTAHAKKIHYMQYLILRLKW